MAGQLSLLFDENLSPRLVANVAEHFPGSTHVSTVGLSRASDEAVWAYARDHSLAIVTKDADFVELALLYGAPPKIVWLRLGNCSTDEVEAILRRASPALSLFADDPTGSVLELR